MATKRKTTTAIVAGVTAAALLLGGTFAWTSISQTAKNEAIVDINPGGRLHDDFNGQNKDVYVENFGDDTTGVPIFARIRLDQYFEVGQDAGINKDVTDRKVTQVLGTDINDVTKWVTYIPGEGDLNDTTKVPANGNWQWTLGNDESNKPIYMPTFNMNKDSLAADINGTYEGTTGGDIVHYDDYKTYTNGQTAIGTEVYDWDDEDAEEEPNPEITTVDTTPRDDADVYHKENQTHTAKPISTPATVMTMAQWIAAGSQPGNYWVYDEDGWAYWANPIEPGETTGLLLDGITMSKVPDDNYYYGINVVAQFATKGDISEFNAGEPGSDQTWTSEAEELFAIVTGSEEIVISGDDTVLAGGTATYTAVRNIFGETAGTQPDFVWTATATDADGNAIEDITMTDGTLTVADTVAAGTKITVTATAGDGTATADGETTVLAGSKTVTVVGKATVTATNGLTMYTVGETTTETFTAAMDDTSIAGTFTWSVTDGDGNTPTDATLTVDADDSSKATLNVGANESAEKLIVTATFKPTEGTAVYVGTYEIKNSDITTTDDMAVSAYAILTDDGSGNGTYAMTFIRANEAPTTANSFQGEKIVEVYSFDEGDDTYAYPKWRANSNVTSVSFANPIAPVTMHQWFSQFASLKSVDFTNLDGSKLTSISDLFYDCAAIESIDMSEVIVSKDNQINIDDAFMNCTSLTELKVPKNMTVVTVDGRTFCYCESLTTITGIETWDVSNVSSFFCMFFDCISLKNIDLSDWKFGSQASFENMFAACEALEQIQGAEEWDVSQVTNMYRTFAGCEVLNLDCSKWDVSNVTTYEQFNMRATGVILPEAWQTTETTTTPTE